jgi:hypothetical protein
MFNLPLTANPGRGHEKYHVGLSLVEFEEDNVTIIYSPRNPCFNLNTE